MKQHHLLIVQQSFTYFELLRPSTTDLEEMKSLTRWLEKERRQRDAVHARERSSFKHNPSTNSPRQPATAVLKSFFAFHLSCVQSLMVERNVLPLLST